MLGNTEGAHFALHLPHQPSCPVGPWPFFTAWADEGAPNQHKLHDFPHLKQCELIVPRRSRASSFSHLIRVQEQW